MKKILFVLLAVAMMFSCQKEPENALSQQSNSDFLKAQDPTPAMNLVIAPNPAYVGDEVTITATTDADCGKLQIQMLVDNSWITVKDVDLSTEVSTLVYTYFANDVGTFYFMSHYVKSGCDYKNAFSPEVALIVNELECEEPLTIAPELVDVDDLGGGNYRFTVQYTVKACEDFTNMKTQGGLTAGATVVTTDPPATNIKTTKQNTIINWIEPDVYANDEFVYTVVFTKKLKNSCTTYDITGAWSAKAWHYVEYPPIEEGGEPYTVFEEYVAGYNNKISYTTPGCPE